ncbi:MAG: DNA polymerase IV [Deltaproteobacteria bacterium]|nr:DNA polymerase IV [Deltaproteobacteria bacterium]
MKSSNPFKHILHLDMDAFYPAVEVLDDPSLKGKPVIVGGSVNRGVVSSASYEARKFGVHSAQPMATALRLCPDAVVLPVRMTRYKEVSQQIFAVFYRFTPLVEPLSIDEAFLDVTGSMRLFGPPEAIAEKIKAAVFSETGLTVSAGVATSKFIAKIASDMDKPDGLTVVPPGGEQAFLDPLPVEKMWGAGKVTQAALKQLNIRSFYDLRRMPADFMERKFGKHGIQMHRLASGLDDRDVVTEHDMKSIGHEETFEKDVVDPAAARRELLSLSNRVARRVRRYGVTGKTVTVKVKYADFVSATRSETLSHSTDDGAVIYDIACRLLKKTEVGKKPARLLGISVSHLRHGATGIQLDLFREEDIRGKRKRLNTALDALHGKFGEKSVLPGSLLEE